MVNTTQLTSRSSTTTSQPPAIGAGGGSSRASKKRAKKKIKQQQQQHSNTAQNELVMQPYTSSSLQPMKRKEKDEDVPLLQTQKKKMKSKSMSTSTTETTILVPIASKTRRDENCDNLNGGKEKDGSFHCMGSENHREEQPTVTTTASATGTAAAATTTTTKKRKNNASNKDCTNDVTEMDDQSIDPSTLDSIVSSYRKVIDILQPYVHPQPLSKTVPLPPDLKSNILPFDHLSRVLFHFLLLPSGISVDTFYQLYWEKKPFLISMNPNMAHEDDIEDDAEDDGNHPEKKQTSTQRNDALFVEEPESFKTHTKNSGLLNLMPKNKKSKKGSLSSFLQPFVRNDPVKREEFEQRYLGILSKVGIEENLTQYPLKYHKDIHVANYLDIGDGDGKKQVTFPILMPPSHSSRHTSDNKVTKLDEYVIANSKEVWAYFHKKGYTIRISSPQTYDDNILALLSLLENEFGCRVDAHAQLTPGGVMPNQGFAPCSSDTESFILQLEGRSHWRLYPPRNRAETLPRHGSSDFTQDDVIMNMKPVMDVELNPGDLLYIPRGYIHQANTCHGGKTSLHLSINTMKEWSWADLLELILPDALEAAVCSESSTKLREGLPRNFLSYMGAMHEVHDDNELPEGLRQMAKQLAQATNLEDGQENSPEDRIEEKMKNRLRKLQSAFKMEAKKRIVRVCNIAIDMITAGCDQMGKRFLSERLPPPLSKEESKQTNENRLSGRIKPNSLVRCVRKGAARIVLEDGKAVLYHCMDNSREYQGNPLSPMEFEVDDAPALEALLTTTHPNWVCVEDLHHGDIEDKIEIAQALFDEGILAVYHEESHAT